MYNILYQVELFFEECQKCHSDILIFLQNLQNSPMPKPLEKGARDFPILPPLPTPENFVCVKLQCKCMNVLKCMAMQSRDLKMGEFGMGFEFALGGLS